MKRLIAKLFVLTAPVLIISSCSNSSNQNKQMTEKKDSIIPAFDTGSLDKAYRPQDDFDSFANGGWKRKNPVPPTEGSWGAFGIIDKENSEVKLKGIIQEVLAKKDNAEGSDQQRIADMYRSFMDTNTIEKLGMEPLKAQIDHIQSIKTLTDWLTVSGELQKIGVPNVLGIYVDADDRNSKMNAVKWAQGGLSLGEKSYYSGTDERMKMIRSEFVKHVDNMAHLTGWTPGTEGMKLDGKALLAFETELAKIQLSNVELRDPIKTYNKVSMAELKALAKNTDWSVFAGVQGLTSDTVVVQNKQYFTSLDKLLNKTSLPMLKFYLYYHTVANFSTYLPKAIKEEKFNFYGRIKGGGQGAKEA